MGVCIGGIFRTLGPSPLGMGTWLDPWKDAHPTCVTIPYLVAVCQYIRMYIIGWGFDRSGNDGAPRLRIGVADSWNTPPPPTCITHRIWSLYTSKRNIGVGSGPDNFRDTGKLPLRMGCSSLRRKRTSPYVLFAKCGRTRSNRMCVRTEIRRKWVPDVTPFKITRGRRNGHG